MNNAEFTLPVLFLQDQYEEVDIITKGGNYGWRVYEGPLFFVPNSDPGGSTPVDSINPIFPVMGYNHSSMNKNIGSASITGGYFYRSKTDPCMYGRYVLNIYMFRVSEMKLFRKKESF